LISRIFYVSNFDQDDEEELIDPREVTSSPLKQEDFERQVKKDATTF
jgi:hypothetical protein